MKSFLLKYLKFQQEVENATKNASNPHFKSKYANLEAVISTVKDTLNSNGLVYIQSSVDTQVGYVAIKTSLIDTETGEGIDSTITLPAGSDAQKYGSALTYARRYSLATVCGITQEDDDGNDATNIKSVTITNNQANTILKIIGSDDVRLKKIYNHYKIEHLQEMTLSQYNECVSFLSKEV